MEFLNQTGVKISDTFNPMLQDVQANIIKHHGRNIAFHLLLKINAIDPAKAWIDTMTKEAVPSGEKSCPNPLDKNIAFGRDKKINGTPTIFFEDGERVPGAISMADFEKRLKEAKSPAGAKEKVSAR